MSINPGIKEVLDSYRAVDVSAYQKRIAEEYAAIGDHVLYGGKYAGSDGERKGAEYIAKELEKIGVNHIDKYEYDSMRFQCNDIDLEVTNEAGDKISFKPGPYSSPGTPKGGLTAEIIDAGEASPQWFDEHDVAGKIVLADSKIGLAGVAHAYICWEAEARGAVGVIIYQADNNIDDTTLRSGTFMKKPTIPVVGLNTIDAKALREFLEKGPAQATLNVDAELLPQAPSTAVIAEIKGKTDERIMFSGHLDHYFTCMQDNIASVCGMLGIAKSIVDAGIKPNRTITFLFSSSHEITPKECLTPYIYGSYYALCEKHPEWIRKTMYDINFEYCALEEKFLRSYGSPEAQDSYNRFMEYMPQANPGFGDVAKDFDPQSYILMAWEDSVSFVSSGITSIANDPITEQMAGDSPYVGRDHSTSDNWDAFSYDALTSATKWYGSLGLFLDQIPIPELNFTDRTNRLRFDGNEQPVLEAMSFDTAEYNALLDSILAKAGQIYEKIRALNGDRTELTEEDLKLIAPLIDLRHKYSALTDTFNAQGFFAPLHKSYIMSVALLSGGIEMLKGGDLESAISNCLMYEGYCGIAYSYGPNVGRNLDQLARDEEARTFNKGKTCRVLVLPETMESLRKKGLAGEKDFAEEIAVFEKELATESELLMKTFSEAVAALKEIDADMAAFLENIA